MQTRLSQKKNSRLTADTVVALAGYGARSSWPSNFEIYQQGTPADGVSVVLRGHVVLRNRIRAGRGFVPSIVTPGETFGVEGLTADGLYVTDAHASDESETLYLSSSQFRAFVREKPGAALQVLGQLMRERCDLLEKLHAMASQNVEQRLVFSLKRMSGDRSLIDGDGRLRLEVRHHRLLCEMVGATRESIALALGRLVGSGVAERRGVTFLIALSELTGHVAVEAPDTQAPFAIAAEQARH